MADHEKLGWAKRLRKVVPAGWRHWIKAHLPLAAQDRLGVFWRAGQPDWTRTRAFSLTADVHGYVRVNLRGREAKGIVSPGADYERLCSQLTEGLLSFVDAETGEPVVSEIKRIDELFPPGSRRERWAPTPCADTSGVVSPRFGQVPWPMPGKNPNGRSGNHTGEGFVLAKGEGIRPQSSLPAGAHILDLPPTIHALLGKRPPEHMRGRVLRELLPTSDSAVRESA
jgi:predicted AlkP superfamily phosphohydrolase/phosphomutase